MYSVFQKEESTKLLAITVSNLNRFSKFFIAEKRMKFPTKLLNIFRHTLSMFSHYLGKVNSTFMCQK